MVIDGDSRDVFRTIVLMTFNYHVLRVRSRTMFDGKKDIL